MTLVYRRPLIRLQNPRPHNTCPGTPSVVTVYLKTPIQPTILILAVIHLGEAEAAAKLAKVVSGAFAPTSEAVLCSGHALAENDLFDEAEVWGENCIVLFVDDRDREILVGVKCPDLTPVARVFFSQQSLGRRQLVGAGHRNNGIRVCTHKIGFSVEEKMPSHSFFHDGDWQQREG